MEAAGDRIGEFLQEEIEMGRLPGAVLAYGGASWRQDPRPFGYAQVFGEKRPMQTNTLFDIASLTKVVATLPSVMILVEQGGIVLDQPVFSYLPDFVGEGKEKVTVWNLLTHTSGLPSSPRFYTYVSGREELLREIYKTELTCPVGKRVTYSDLGFILLGLIVEKVSGEKLDAFSWRHVFEPMDMSDTGFNPTDDAKQDAAATEFFREMGGYQVGQVHDRNARVMGGIAGHAGLFSSMEDLIRYSRFYLQTGQPNGGRMLRKETVQEMARNQTPGLGTSRGLGWVVYEPGDGSFGGVFPSAGYGHTGFTGTSLYLNPELDLYVILLTNRLHYGRTEDIFLIRERVHRLIAESL